MITSLTRLAQLSILHLAVLGLKMQGSRKPSLPTPSPQVLNLQTWPHPREELVLQAQRR